MNTLVEILNKERFITCHSYVQSEINMLMKVADSMGFTLNTFTHILEGYKVADKMKEHGAGGSTFFFLDISPSARGVCVCARRCVIALVSSVHFSEPL